MTQVKGSPPAYPTNGGKRLPRVQIQKAQTATWDDYMKVTEAMGVDTNPPEGLIVHAAGEEGGTWRIVAVWESEAAWEKFRDERLMPTVIQVHGQEALENGPPQEVSFEAKHLVKP